jgi:diguanylate cyclase (GGDEF)-like protein
MARETDRLEALRSTELLDSPPEEAFDRLTRLAAGLIGAPVALVSLVDERRQFFKSALGLKEPWASRRETPLTHSFCKYATQSRSPLIVDDARLHPMLRDNFAIRDLDVIAYAGMPLIVEDEAVGALCVVDDKPRVWSESEMRLLHDLAEAVVSEIELRVALRKMREQRALTDALLESIGDGVLGVDASRRFILSNATARAMFEGFDVGSDLPEAWSALHRARREDGAPLADEDGAIPRALRGEAVDDLVYTLQAPRSSAPTWIEASARPVRGAKGEIVAAVGVYRDVTERKRLHEQQRRTEQVYREIVQHLPNGGVFMIDRDLRYVTADGPVVEGLARRAGLSSIVGLHVGEAASEKNREALVDASQAALRGERRHLEIERGGHFLDIDFVPLYDGAEVTHALAFLHDVTTRKAELEELERARAALERHAGDLEKLAVTDELTGLLNRRGFMLMAQRDLRVAERSGRTVALVFIDLNGLKKINDTLGHDVGDRAIRDTADLLKRTFRTSDVVARLGGDEFVVLVTDAVDPRTEVFAERLKTALAAYNETARDFRLSASVGSAVFDPAHPTALEDLLSKADDEMYEEKTARNKVGGSVPRVKTE